ncbi:MAG: NAD(P)/FAD-dependent oxidoreductase [Planctomycetia bacterium]|nr:NAD(P)/FAD-dependent oxidoreductase [Planctomycetia bacterium]
MPEPSLTADLAVVGAGAAGLAAAIFTARQDPALRIVALDGAKKPGAKILVSGGGRCNVTNREVRAEDFCGGSSHIIKRILNELPVAETIEFFREIGVDLHEEEFGKLFPDTNKAQTVLSALLAEARRLNVDLRCEYRVIAIEKTPDGFDISTDREQLRAERVVLATGGKSLPKTGSDGFGYSLAEKLGHTIVPTTPGLAPLLLDGTFHQPLSGIAHDVQLTILAEGRKPVRIRGPMLWTHFGVSGPAALDSSRHWHRAKIENRPVTIKANLLPDETLDSLEARLVRRAAVHPRQQIAGVVADLLPTRLAGAILDALKINHQIQMAHFSRTDRRRLASALIEWPMPVTGSRGYAYAEVTAGGVSLTEIDAKTMQSRVCPGLYLVGEILDCEGRLGGFNFQWAWCTGRVAARGITGR